MTANKVCIKCGGLYTLEEYHDNDADRNLCHRCYRGILPMFTCVSLDETRRGIVPGNPLSMGQAEPGDILMVFAYDFRKQCYVLTADGLLFFATDDMFHVVNRAASKYIKQYQRKDVSEWMLEDIQRKLEEYKHGTD